MKDESLRSNLAFAFDADREEDYKDIPSFILVGVALGAVRKFAADVQVLDGWRSRPKVEGGVVVCDGCGCKPESTPPDTEGSDMSEPTDNALDHGAMVNRIQNASLRFSKERGDYRGAFPMTYEQAEAFLFCLRKEGLCRAPQSTGVDVEKVRHVARCMVEDVPLSELYEDWNFPHGTPDTFAMWVLQNVKRQNKQLYDLAVELRQAIHGG